MKKKLPIMLLSALLLVGIVSCGGGETTSSSTGSQPGTTSASTPTTSTPTPSTSTPTPSTSVEDPLVVESVKITNYEEEDLVQFDGSTFTLKAEVTSNKANAKLKVDWSSSNKDLATVTNGVVRFGKVKEDTQVTIIATSRDDATKKDEVTFTIKHAKIDLANSRGTLDKSLFMDEDTISAEASDVAMIFSDVYSTKFYVEANITFDDFNPNDDYPKFGIMTGTSEAGWWNQDEGTGYGTNAFYYVDTMKSGLATGWNSFNFVPQTELKNDWNWGKQLGAFNVSNENKVEKGVEYRMGLLRNGTDYHLFAMKGDNMYCYKTLTYTDIAADQPSYAWIGGWNSAVTVKNFKALVDDEVDAMYDEVTAINLATTEMVMFLNDTYQINVTTNTLNYDKSKLTFETSNAEVATVDERGLITAGKVTGDATITIKYGELTKEFKVTVTDDAKFKVDLDGKMDDKIWTDTVKANKYTFALNGEGEGIDFYGSRNSRGIYIYADYYVNNIKHNNDNWWENDNMEFRFGKIGNLTITDMDQRGHDNTTGQVWLGVKGSNAEDYFAPTALTEDATTGKYRGSFEFFMSYERLGVAKDDVIAIKFGSNPQSGWRACKWFDGSNLADYLKITEDGLTFKVDESLICPEGNHTYGAWTTTTAATCNTDGERVHYCTLCGHAETEVIKAAGGEHTYDPEAITVINAATCLAEGSASATCTSCGTTFTITLPKDKFNHAGTYTDGVWSCCHNRLQNKVVFDYPAGSNWITNNFIAGVMMNDADWSIELDVDMIRTNGNQDCARGWAGQIQVENDSGEFDNLDKHKWCWRQDWWGWGYYNPANGENVTEDQENKQGNCGYWDESAFTNGFNDYKDTVLDNCNLNQTISFSHETGVITIVTIVTAKAGPEAGKFTTITYTSRAFPLGKKVEVCFGMLWNMEGTHTINSVKMTGNVVSGPHAKDGAVGLVG